MKIFNKQLNNDNKKTLASKVSGFTIIETLVAVFILSIAITTFLAVVTQSIVTARYAKNEITANYLTQEAADYIRNQRDSVAFLNKVEGSNAGWDKFKLEFFNKGCDLDDGCNLVITTENNTTEASITTCKEVPPWGYYNCPVLKINGKDSHFKRRINMYMVPGNGWVGAEQVKVYVMTEWLNGDSSKVKILNFTLSNWMDY